MKGFALMSESKIVFQPQRLYARRDLVRYTIVFLVGMLFIYGDKSNSLSCLEIFGGAAFVGFLFGWAVVQIKLFWIQRFMVDGSHVHLKYFIKAENKSFPRSAVRLKEQEGSWWKRRGINVYVNGHEVATIDSRFDIDAILSHPDLNVERA